MSNFVHENSQRNLHNDEGLKFDVVEMDVDQDTYPVEMVTNFDIHRDIKPPEKEIETVTENLKKYQIRAALLSLQKQVEKSTTSGWGDFNYQNLICL